MTPANWIQILALIVTLLIFVMPIIYFAGKLVGKLETLITRVSGLEAKIEKFKETCFTKVEAGERITETDKIRQAQWSAIDKMKKTLLRLCFKVQVNPEDDEKSSHT